jgi:hypothetical protein
MTFDLFELLSPAVIAALKQQVVMQLQFNPDGFIQFLKRMKNSLLKGA